LLDTYRYKEHCGPSDDINLGYRSKKEFNNWIKRDPLVYCKKLISKSFANSKNLITKIDLENEKICKKAFLFAEKSSLPSPANIKLNIYS
jgi:pyruvate dehydrogenase E1 component alpha subunit